MTFHARDINAAERVALAIALRCQKLTYREIAARCGYGTPQACQQAVQREMDRRIVAQVDELRREESALLDALHARIWPLAMGQGEADADAVASAKRARIAPNLWAVDRLLAISEARRRLMGLDAKGDEASVGTVLVRSYGVDVEAV